MIEDVDATFGVLRPKPGDVIVVKVKARLTPEAAEHLRDSLVGRMVEGVQVWIIDDTVDITHIESP